MTDNFLQKLEEKVMILLTELETLRKELNQLRHENSTFKAEKVNYVKKLQGVLSLLDSMEDPQEFVAGEIEELQMQEEFANA